MRSATKQKLDQALRQQWYKRGAIAAGVGLLIAGGLWYTGLDASVQNKRVKGTIETVDAAAGMSSTVVENGLSVMVKLVPKSRVTKSWLTWT